MKQVEYTKNKYLLVNLLKGKTFLLNILFKIFQKWSVVTVNETNHSSEMENSHRLEFLVGLYTDLEKLSTKMCNFIDIMGDKIATLSPTVIVLLSGK